MTRLFDASVLVAAYSREGASAQALALLTGEPLPAVNALALAEARVALIRKRNRGEPTIRIREHGERGGNGGHGG